MSENKACNVKQVTVDSVFNRVPFSRAFSISSFRSVVIFFKVSNFYILFEVT